MKKIFMLVWLVKMRDRCSEAVSTHLQTFGVYGCFMHCWMTVVCVSVTQVGRSHNNRLPSKHSLRIQGQVFILYMIYHEYVSVQQFFEQTGKRILTNGPWGCAALCHAGGCGDASSRTHLVKYSLEPWQVTTNHAAVWRKKVFKKSTLHALFCINTVRSLQVPLSWIWIVMDLIV